MRDEDGAAARPYEEKLELPPEAGEGDLARRWEVGHPQAPTPASEEAGSASNFTDEESVASFAVNVEGFVQGYNAQAAVDVDSHMVVTNHVTDHCNDKHEVAPTLRQLDA